MTLHAEPAPGYYIRLQELHVLHRKRSPCPNVKISQANKTKALVHYPTNEGGSHLAGIASLGFSTTALATIRKHPGGNDENQQRNCFWAALPRGASLFLNFFFRGIALGSYFWPPRRFRICLADPTRAASSLPKKTGVGMIRSKPRWRSTQADS